VRLLRAARAFDRVGPRRETSVALCIDVEPDPFVFGPADSPPWFGFERLIQRVPGLRRRLREVTGAPAAFTWFLRMDPQVAETWGSLAWIAEKYAHELAELTGAGDELGLHTHVWRWETNTGAGIADFEDPAWGEHCLEMGLDAFERSFGRGCAAHRGGTRFLSGAMLSTLETRGVSVDLTVEPGGGPLGATQIGETARGLTPDYRGVPTRPYRSTPSRFPGPDPAARTGPLLVPLLSVRRRRPPFRRVPLPLWEPFAMPNLAAELLRKPPIVAVAVRSSSAVNPEEWDVIEKNLEHLAHHRQMVFVTASEATDRYKRRTAEGNPSK
jgi:hypothetical protein